MKAATNNGNRSLGLRRVIQPSWLFRQAGILPALMGDEAGTLLGAEQARMHVLQYRIPFGLVFEHDLAQEANGRHAVIEQLVMELL